MSDIMVTFKNFLEETKRTGCTCWTGYKRKPGTKPCAPGSCVKEELGEEATPYWKKPSFIKRMSQIAKQERLAREKKEAEAKKSVKEEAEDQFDMIEEVIEELAFINNVDSETLWEKLEELTDEELLEYAIDAKGHKSSTGGLTQKGVDYYRSKTPGSKLKMAVTTPPSKLKAGSKAANRRKSFCARMSGVDGPMKDEKGRPTRKALALRKWNC
jgi:hypothetical protein